MHKVLLYLSLFSVLLSCSCKETAPDYSVRRPAALSLPKLEEIADEDKPERANAGTLDVGMATERSVAVFLGRVISIDSVDYKTRNSKKPVYLFGVQVLHPRKGALLAGAATYIVATSLLTTRTAKEMLFFVSPVDSANVFAYSTKLHYQWTTNAPVGLGMADFIAVSDTAAEVP